MQLRAAAFPGIVDANKAIIGVSYVAAYVALDWVSFIEPYGLDRSNRTSTAFERIVKQTIELCQPDLDRASVTARFELAADLPPVMVDILQIEQVLLNLMRNSIEAISDTGRRHGST
jgi:signal transduction histidine kinase